MKSVAVIGAGITGLAAANRILERSQELNEPVSVSLLEAGPRAGGIIQSEERDGFLLERGPDAFISEKPQALNLANRLGLNCHLIETNPTFRRSFIVRNGKLRPVPEGFQLLAPGRMRSFLTSDIFSWSGKLRMAMDLLVPRRQVNGASEESLAQFVRRRLGREALERMAQPMIGGIYTADPEQLSLQATMPRFLEMERRHRSLILGMRRNRQSVQSAEVDQDNCGTSGARYSLFLSFDRGMQLLTDSLASRIDALSTQQSGRNSLRLNSRVRSLESIGHGDVAQWLITNDSGDVSTVDAVCVALPAFATARLIGDLDPQLAAELQAIKYASSATINLAYKREDIPHPLDGFGFVVPIIERRSIMACTFSSVKFAGRAPENHVLLRVFVGGALQPEMTELPKSELLARIRVDLRDLLGIDSEPIFHEISRWQESMPQYNIGHVNRIRSIGERVNSLPGLALAGNAYTGLGIPDCIRSGEDAADALLASI